MTKRFHIKNLFVIISLFVFSLLFVQDTYATNLTYMDGLDFWNNGTKTTRPGTVLSDNNFITSIAASLSPMRISKIAFAFPINEQKEGQYINYNFNTGLNIQNGSPGFEGSCQGLRATVMFANSNAYNGIPTEINQVSVSCSKSSNNKELWLGVTSNAKLLTSQRVSHAYITFENTDNYIFSCNNSPGAMTQLCSSATLNYYRPVNYLQASQDPSLAGQQTIINQNDVIINQNQQMIDNQQQTYDYLTDSTPPSVDTSGLDTSVGWLPAGPVDSILTLPLQLLQGIVNVFTNTNCSPLQIPVPFVNENISLPCVSTLMDQVGFTPIWGIVGGVISAVIIWNTLKWLYKFVDDTLTFRENNSGMWGGL